MPLEDDDMLFIQRGDQPFKTTYKELKEQIATELKHPYPICRGGYQCPRVKILTTKVCL